MWRRVVKLAKNFKGGYEPKVEIQRGGGRFKPINPQWEEGYDSNALLFFHPHPCKNIMLPIYIEVWLARFVLFK